ncbi:MAG: carboxypeptidase regulatory-like domain-containing protein, partial [Chlamydiae bacterium]|nr:carboxypeptidase regulatory-like domain-containing protein [Chlamydiota bacterium]MBI3277059.1 carboxypeptidase regulatory-like domain-containing protein [Chlamydiota bacterium]
MYCLKNFFRSIFFSFFVFLITSSICLGAESGSISGEVKTSEDILLSDIAVVAFDVSDQVLSNYAFTDVNGQYKILDLPPGDYYLYTSNEEGYSDELYQNIPCSNQNCNLVDGTPVHVGEGADTPGIDFELNVGQLSITGKVSDVATGSPLKEVEVDLYDQGGNYQALDYSDADGNYHFYDLKSGVYYLTTFDTAFYVDELYNNISCEGGHCNILEGTPVNVGETAAQIDFSLVKSAVMTVTGDNAYVLFVNGVEIGRDDDWTTVENYEVALNDGDSIALEVTDAGWIASVACQIEKDGIIKQVTDFTWQVSTTLQEGWQASGFDH